MIIKKRFKSKELLIMELLEKRMNLSTQQKSYLQSLERGYRGEILFDKLFERINCECLILNDLLLNYNNTTFQIDSLLITSNQVNVFEIKNYEGDYIYESDRLFTISKKEIINPLHQLNRSKFLLQQLILEQGYSFNIEAFVIFINPNFTLYQAPLNKPFIFPTQINSFLNKLNQNRAQLGERQKQLAKLLLSLHIYDSPYSQIPDYNYEQLKKGITCHQCESFSLKIDGKLCICQSCGYKESVTTAITRSVEEFKLLFPDKLITTNIIYEWCKIINSKKRIQRTLASNYKKVGNNKWAYYE